MTDTPRVTLNAAERHVLRLARRRLRLKWKHIAREVGVSPKLLARYQCGERRPTATVLDAWRRVLGIKKRWEE